MATDLARLIDYLEDLKSEEVKKRLVAVRHLSDIARAFGPEKSRQSLLPFLKEYEDDEEEIMLELANQMYLLSKILPEKEQSLPELVSYYSIVLNYEDFSVIDEGLRTLERLVNENSLRHECLLTLAKRLQAAGTTKALISASRLCCRLGAFMPSKCSPEIAKILNDNAAHKCALVRKETAVCLREVLIEAGPFEFVALNNLKKLVKDAQDGVRVAAIESLCARTHSRAYFMASVFNVLLGCLEQRSWRARYVLVKQMPEALGSTEPKSRRQLTGFYFKCLNDPELEVAVKALEMLRSLPGLLEPEEINEKVLPELQKAAASESADVRRALAGSLPHLSTHFQKFAEPAAAVKALIWQLFKDESPEVRVSLFVNLEPFLRTQTLQATLTNFLGVLQELLNDKTWKVRLDAVKVIELLLTKFSDEVANDERLIKALGEKLSDKVAAVRRAAVTSIRTICAALGLAWSERHGVGLFHGFATSLNYLYRLNFPLGIAEICKCLSAQTLAKEVELLIKLGKDPVANVRANTLIALVRVSQRCEDKGLADRTRKMAEELSADLDGETQRLAQKISTTKDWKGLAEQFSTQMA